jgi:heat shock protein HtpX
MSFLRTTLGRDTGLQARMLITFFVLGLIYAVFAAVLFAAGAQVLVLCLAIAAVVLLQLLFSDRLALKAMRAHVVAPEQAPGLHAMVERLCVQADLPKPKIAVSDLPLANAFAVGLSPKRAVVCTTTKLMQTLQPRELEAVIAHELGHVKNRDVMVMTLASFFASVAALVAQVGLFFGGGPGGDHDNEQPAFWVVALTALGVYVISHLLLLTLSRYREFAADRQASLVTGRPSELAAALTKLSGSAQRLPQKDLRAVEPLAAFFIVPPRAKGFFSVVLSTHPSVEKRIERLEQLEAQLNRRGGQAALALSPARKR